MTTEKSNPASSSVTAFFNLQIDRHTLCRHLGTARNYRRTLNSFRNFLCGEDITFAMLTEPLVLEYEKWLSGHGVTRNSSSFYIRILRSVYNKAVRDDIATQTHPFANVYTGVDLTRKRAVAEDVVACLLRLDLRSSKSLALARDLFVFSYCTRGMSFVDIAFLRKCDVADGFISYVRRKTGQRLTVRIEPCVERIIRRYESATAATPYLFPVITSADPVTAYRQYQMALNYHNRKLKRLGRAIGEPALSSYTARHTWATAARKHNVPLSVISQGMGHTSEKTTQIYLDSLENSVVDDANSGIVAVLNAV